MLKAPGGSEPSPEKEVREEKDRFNSTKAPKALSFC